MPGGTQLGVAHGKILIDVSGVSSSVGQAVSALGRLQGVAATAGLAVGTAIAAGVAVAGAALGALGIRAIQAGSDVEEMMGKFSVVFGQYAQDTAAALGTLAQDVGRNRYELMGFAATFQDTFVPLGFARDEAAAFSTELTQLTVDIASFNNIAEPQVLMDLQSAIVGNHETMRKYGVIITETTLNQQLLAMGIQGGIAAATEQEKVMARLNIIYAGTTDAQGDAIRTAGSFANQMRALKSSVQETVQGIGLGLLPLATQFVQAFRAIEPALSQILAGVFAILRNIVEVGIEFVKSLASALGINFDDLAGNAETWGANIVTMLANGMAAAASAVIAVLNELGSLIAYWLAPGSPPRLLPDLPDWGASAMTEFMNGWSSGDFSVFEQLRGTVEGMVRQLGADLPEVDLINAVIGSREAMAQAIEQMRTVGSVSKATMDAVVAGAGPASEAVRAYVNAMLQSEGAMKALGQTQTQLRAVQDITLENYRQFAGTLSGRVSPAVQAHLQALRQLEQANSAYEQAQARLNAVTTKYDNILGPLNNQLRALRNEQTAAAEDDELARLNEDINTGWLTGAELREAIAQRDAILLQRRIREVEAQRDAEVGAAEEAVDATQTAQEAAEERAEATRQAAIDAAEAEVAAAQRKVDALDEQIARNQAIIAQIQEEIRLQAELAKAIEDAAKKAEEAASGGGSGGSGGAKGAGGAGGIKPPAPIGPGSGPGDLKDLLEGRFADIFKDVQNIFKPVKDQAAELGKQWAKVVDALKGKWKEFTDRFKDFGEGFSLENIQEKIQPFLDGLAPITTVIENIVQTVKEKVELFGQFIAEQVDKVRSWVSENQTLISDFLGVVGTIIGGIVVVVSTVYITLTGLFDITLVALDGFITYLLQWATAVMQIVTGDFAGAFQTLATIGQTILTTIQNVFIAFIDWVAGWFGSSWEGIKTTWAGIWDNIKATVSLAWEAIQTALGEALVAIQTSIGTKINEIFAAMGLDLDEMKTKWNSIWKDVQFIAETVWGLIKEAVATKVAEVKRDIETKINQLKAWWDPIWDEIKTKVDEIWTQIRDVVGSKLDEIRAKIEEKINAAREWIEQRKADFQSTGENLILGLRDGILAKAGEIIAAATALIAQVVGAARAALEEGSPSKVFIRMGMNAGEGMAIGITNSTPRAVRSAKEMAKGVIGAMNSLGTGLNLSSPLTSAKKMIGVLSTASDMVANTRRKFDMANWQASSAAANNILIGNSIKPMMGASSRPPVNDQSGVMRLDDEAIAALSMERKSTYITLHGNFPNVVDGETLWQEVSDYSAAYNR